MLPHAAAPGDRIFAFRRDGFLIVRRLFDDAEVRALAAWIDELAARPPDVGRQMVYYEDSVADPVGSYDHVPSALTVIAAPFALSVSAAFFDSVADSPVSKSKSFPNSDD